MAYHYKLFPDLKNDHSPNDLYFMIDKNLPSYAICPSP